MALQRPADIGARTETEGSALDLLNETIARAARECPYYAEAFHGVELELHALSDLARFPLLLRDTVLTRGEDLLARSACPAIVGMTGGTTASSAASGGPLLFFKSTEEVAVKQRLMSALGSGAWPRPLVMHLVNLAHGLDPNSAVDGCFQVPLERGHHVEAVVSLLRRSFTFEGFTSRVAILAGALRLLKAITMLCVEQGIDGGEFGVGVVASSSNQLTSRWRGLLQDYWRAEVEEFYGMSEVPGLHARRCHTCGHFHCSGAVVTEVLAVDEDAPVAADVGRLIATSLYPLAAMQPMIRYDTGDLVELFEPCPASSAQPLEFLGRCAQTIRLPGEPGSTAVLPPILVNDVLDGFPEIATTQFAFAQQLGIKSSIGFLKWGLAWAARAPIATLELTAELRWPPSQFPAERDALSERLRSRLLARSAPLSALLATNQIDLKVTLREPGATTLVASV